MSELDVFINWLQLQSEGAELKWQSDHVWAERPYALGWVDVNVPAFEEEVGWNWTLSILSFDDEELAKTPPGHLVFGWDKDLTGLSETYGDVTHHDLDGWSPAAVTAFMNHFSAEHAERPDLRWSWDDSEFASVPFQAAQQAIKDIEESRAQLTRIGQTDGGMDIMVAPQAMDFLLEDPERAALIVGEFMSFINSEEASGSV